MLKNYLLIAYRNLVKHKFFSLINIFGLSIGLACTIVLGLYVIDELSFDTFHSKSDQIYRILEHKKSDNTSEITPYVGPQIGPGSLKSIPEIKEYSRITRFGRITFGYDEFRDYEEFWLGDSTIFQVFDFNVLEGSPKDALSKPNQVVLTESTARKYFGDESPLGKTLYTNILEAEVTGVIEDFPSNSHISVPAIFSTMTGQSFIDIWEEWEASNWSSNYFTTYLVLEESASPDVVAQKIDELVRERRAQDIDKQSRFELQPLSKIHFYSSNVEDELNIGEGNIQYVWIFSAIAFLVLLVAIINYINLSTARAAKRAKEVGLRKTIGAQRHHLIAQFMGESVSVTLIAVLLAVTSVQILMPIVNELSGKTLSFKLLSSTSLFVLIGITLFTALLAGSFPAFYLTRYNATEALRQKASDKKGVNVRQSLVVAQFAISIGMMMATAVVYFQMQYVREMDMGYEREEIITLDINSRALRNNYETFKASLENTTGVKSVTASNRIPGDWKGIPEVEIANSRESFHFFKVDEDFLSTYSINIIKGNNFSGLPADSTQIIINEAAAKLLGENVIGTQISITSNDEEELDRPYVVEVLGIVKNFHAQSVKEEVKPAIISYRNSPIDNIDYYSLKVERGNMQGLIENLKDINQSIDPENPLEYHFLDQKFSETYQEDARRGNIFGIITLVAILIACLGLLALSVFTVEQRTKEIGIRKVLGASVSQIAQLVTKEFVILVTISFVIGAPLALFFMRKWLQEFAYHIALPYWLILPIGLLSLFLVLVSIGYQTLRAAQSDPAKSLRYE